MTVRLAPVSEQVAPMEQHIQGKIDADALSEKEALAVELAMRISADPHMVDDGLFNKLKTVYSEEEIVEMVFACGIFNWGNKFNITMHMDTGSETEYGEGMEYRQEALG